MGHTVTVNFQTKRIESAGLVLGQFTPSSKTEGEVRLDGRSFNYRFFTFTHGYNFSVYQNGLEIGVLQHDSHGPSTQLIPIAAYLRGTAKLSLIAGIHGAIARWR
jgi:hypothetical protein